MKLKDKVLTEAKTLAENHQSALLIVALFLLPVMAAQLTNWLYMVMQ